MNKAILGSQEKIIFCKKCVESNKRYISTLHYKRTKDEILDTAMFDDKGVCLSCRYYEEKEKTDWKLKEKELVDILDRHRRNDGNYDVLVPGSGGKDSIFTSFILKEKYNMHPLTCTWAPGEYTDIGWKNFKSWLDAGFDNILFTPNKKVHKLLTKLAFKNLLNPFQPFILGQYYFPLKLGIEKKIKLVIYGDGTSESSVGKYNINEHKKRNISVPRVHYSTKGEKIFLGGEKVKDIIEKYKLNKIDLLPYVNFNVDDCINYAQTVNPDIKIFQLSATTGEGMDNWYDWLQQQVQENSDNKATA